MTISTSASQTILLGNGVANSFSFNFIADSAADIQVVYTDTTNTQTTLSPSQYTLVINPPAAGQIWGIGGSVTYPLVGSPIANGTSLTISRLLPYTQVISISNQGDFAPQVIEEMGDTLEMQIQQLAARTTQFRGIWQTNTSYTIGDIVQDGANGANTKNYYICTISNASGVWATDLAAGDWALSVSATVPTGATTLTGDVTGTGTGTIATTIGANKVTNAKLATMPARTFKMNNTSATATPVDATISQLNAVLGAVLTVHSQVFSSNGTYTPTTGMLYCIAEIWGGGGGGGGAALSVTGAVGSGGGAGGYARKTLSAATIGASQTVTVGAGGGGGAIGGTGSTGGTTSLGAIITATGGTGGSSGSSASPALGGTGGTGASGDFNGIGEYGQVGVPAVCGGGGGNTAFGRGGVPVIPNGAGVAAPSNTGGGGGGAAANNTTGQTGGAGGSGYVIITEFCSA